MSEVLGGKTLNSTEFMEAIYYRYWNEIVSWVSRDTQADVA